MPRSESGVTACNPTFLPTPREPLFFSIPANSAPAFRSVSSLTCIIRELVPVSSRARARGGPTLRQRAKAPLQKFPLAPAHEVGRREDQRGRFHLIAHIGELVPATGAKERGAKGGRGKKASSRDEPAFAKATLADYRKVEKYKERGTGGLPNFGPPGSRLTSADDLP